MVAIEASLPLPVQDSEIVGHLLRVGTSITNHAHSFFTSSVAIDPQELNQHYLVQLLGHQAPIDAGELAQLLADPKSRTAAVRFGLAWCILQHIRWQQSLQVSSAA